MKGMSRTKENQMNSNIGHADLIPEKKKRKKLQKNRYNNTKIKNFTHLFRIHIQYFSLLKDKLVC
jgi:hypothetical protein